jgi:hypothetical protein
MDILLHNPIKLINHIFDANTKSWSTKTYIFMGNQPDEIKKAIEKNNTKEIKKWFPNVNFKTIQGSQGGQGAQGGNLEITEDMLISMDDLSQYNNENNENNNEQSPFIVDNKSSANDLGSSANDIRSSNGDEKLKKDFLSSSNYIWDYNLYLDDKVSEIKLKINKIFGIPIFRQHLWYIQGKKHSIPLKYNFYQNGVVHYIDFYNSVIAANNESDKLYDVPVDMTLYQNKDVLKIEAYDSFEILENFYDDMQDTELHLVDLETIIGYNRESMITNLLGDKNQLQIFYYGFIVKYFPMLDMAALVEYIDSKSLSDSYPELEPAQISLKYIDKQEEIQSSVVDLYAFDQHRIKRIDQIFTRSLTETTLKVNSAWKNKIINLRLLFDLFPLDEDVDAIRLYDIYKGRHIILDKFRDHKSEEVLIPGVLFFSVIIRRQPLQRLNMYLYPNGAYSIKGSWGDDQNYEFDDIHKIAQRYIAPVINKINSFASQNVMYHGSKIQLPVIDKSNTKFIDISISMFWKKMLTTAEFEIFKQILSSFVSARIMIEKEIDKQSIIYYFKKGMYDFDPKRIEKTSIVDNYYSYLTNSDIRQKWFTLFAQVRIFKVTQRFNDIKFEITGIKEGEYEWYNKYITLLMSIFMHTRNASELKDTDTSDDQSNMKYKKPLSNLKEQDPHLYNFKKIYNSDIVYSKLCQKPFQPVLLTQYQYDKLPADKKSKVTKYWNFTTNTNAFYQCPNPKYPNLRFLIGKHPKNYCIPCCKITAPSEGPNDKQKMIYQECIKNHLYDPKSIINNEDANLQSRYVMSYGKPIDVGRLSFLPESSLDSLLFDNETDFIINTKYYLYGVEQYNNMGYMYVLMHALKIQNGDTKAFMSLLVQTIKSKDIKFENLLNGEVTLYFDTSNDMVNELYNILNSSSKLKPNTKSNFTEWNALFMDIADKYFNIITMVFQDKETVIYYKVPEYLQNPLDIHDETKDYLLVLHNIKDNTWNPIYLINKDAYFKSKIIERRLFKTTEPAVVNIFNMLKHIISTRKQQQNQNSEGSNMLVASQRSDLITLDIIKKFIDGTKYKIVDHLINKENLCYGVILSGLGYIPIHLSYFKQSGNSTYEFSNDLPAWKDLNSFITNYNNWIYKESERLGSIYADVSVKRPMRERIDPIFPLIDIEKYIFNEQNKCIGFISNGLNWYTKPFFIRTDKKYNINYDPIAINNILQSTNPKPSLRDGRISNLSDMLYNRYKYQLLVLSFIQIFNKQKNIKVRTNLANMIKKTDFKVKDSLELLKQIITPDGNTKNALLNSDIENLRMQIAENPDKKVMLDILENNYYNFDTIILDKLKSMPKPQIKEYLSKVINEFFSSVDKNNKTNTQINNVLSVDLLHKKLDKKELDGYLDLLAAQIKNPFMEKYLFSPLFQDIIIDYFKFIRRDGEHIEIEFI